MSNVNKVIIRQLIRVPLVTSPPIDAYLEDEDINVFYERWETGIDKFGWEEKVLHRGGVSSITCEMANSIPRSQLIKIYGVRRASRLLEEIKGVE